MKISRAILLLLGVVSAEEKVEATKVSTPQMKELLNHFDLDAIHNDLQQDVQSKLELKVKELVEAQLREQIEKSLNQKVSEMVENQSDADRKWQELRVFQKENWDNYAKLMLREKFTDILAELQHGDSNDILREFWPELPQDAKDVDAINVRFDRKKNTVEVISVEKDKKNRPLYEWKADVDAGKISKTTRLPDATHEKVLEQLVDPESLKHDVVTLKLDESNQSIKNLGSISGTDKLVQDKDTQPVEKVDEPKKAEKQVTTDVTPAKKEETALPQIPHQDWDELEMQRDIAFKIMYFFIIFIVMTFGLLYLYYRMNQQAAREEREKRGQKSSANDTTFFDFLAGQMEEENQSYLVNPNARQNDGRFDFMIGQSNTSSGSVNIGNRRDHREGANAGFGANNLEELNNNLYQC